VRERFIILGKLISTQLPQAVGAAYSLKMDKKDACAITYFGDGGTSEVDEQSLITYLKHVARPF
jgi:2-oxoisovalerate dehydrogenase E1 component alpha subunit